MLLLCVADMVLRIGDDMIEFITHQMLPLCVADMVSGIGDDMIEFIAH